MANKKKTADKPSKMPGVCLQFLLLPKPSKKAWSYRQAKMLVLAVERAYTKGETDMNKVFAKYGSGKASSSCRAFLSELSKAAKKGMSLEEYFAKGRPDRPQLKKYY